MKGSRLLLKLCASDVSICERWALTGLGALDMVSSASFNTRLKSKESVLCQIPEAPPTQGYHHPWVTWVLGFGFICGDRSFGNFPRSVAIARFLLTSKICPIVM